MYAQGQIYIIHRFSTENCREPARDIPLVTKVMRKEARHTQRRDRASGVPLDILEHLPPKIRVCLLYCSVLLPLTLLGAVPHHHLALSDKELTAPVNKFLGNQECLNPNPSDGSLTRLTSLPGLLQLCIRLFTVSQPRKLKIFKQLRASQRVRNCQNKTSKRFH